MNTLAIAVFVALWAVVLGFAYFVLMEEAEDRRRDASFERDLAVRRARLARRYNLPG